MQEIRSNREQIARWYRELQHYGFIVMTAPGCLGLNGKGKAPRWRLTELGFMNDPPTKDFLRWRGVKFRDQKNQNPGPEIGGHTGPEKASTSGRKIGIHLKPKVAPENPAKGKAQSGPENGSITKSYHCVGAQSLPRPRGKAGRATAKVVPLAPGATVMRTDLRSPKLTKAIRHAIDEARLAYEFVPNSYTASALNACLAVEQDVSRGGSDRAGSRSSPRHHQQPPNHQPSEDTMTTANDNTPPRRRARHMTHIVANRKEAGRVIDIETCEITWWLLQLL